MLREIRNIRQTSGEYFRRWFQGDDLDLLTWEDSAGKITRFQITRRVFASLRMLEYILETDTCRIYEVDSGESEPMKFKMSGIMLSVPVDDTSREFAFDFQKQSGKIKESVRSQVQGILKNLSERNRT